MEENLNKKEVYLNNKEVSIDLTKLNNLDKEINYPDLDNGEMLFM